MQQSTQPRTAAATRTRPARTSTSATPSAGTSSAPAPSAPVAAVRLVAALVTAVAAIIVRAVACGTVEIRTEPQSAENGVRKTYKPHTNPHVFSQCMISAKRRMQHNIRARNTRYLRSLSLPNTAVHKRVPPLCPRPPRSRSGCCLPPPLGCPESPSSSE
jgi:hypothetical protein